MPYEFKITRRVEFVETDMAGIVHFANFFRYMEAAEHAFFRSLGLSIHQEVDGKTIGWPRVDASCQFKRPVRFEDEIEIHLVVRAVKARSILYESIFSKLEGDQKVEVARGTCTSVCVVLDENGSGMTSIEIPENFTRMIEAAPSE